MSNYNLSELRQLAFQDKRMSDFTRKELNYFLRARIIYDWFRHGMITDDEGKNLMKGAVEYYCE